MPYEIDPRLDEVFKKSNDSILVKSSEQMRTRGGEYYLKLKRRWDKEHNVYKYSMEGDISCDELEITDPKLAYPEDYGMGRLKGVEYSSATGFFGTYYRVKPPFPPEYPEQNRIKILVTYDNEGAFNPARYMPSVYVTYEAQCQKTIYAPITPPTHQGIRTYYGGSYRVNDGVHFIYARYYALDPDAYEKHYTPCTMNGGRVILLRNFEDEKCCCTIL